VFNAAMATRVAVTDQSGVRIMQRLTARMWRPESSWHVGDLAWGRNMHIGREPEWPTAYWTADGADEIVAWAWGRLPGHLDLAIDPAHATQVGPEVLAWFESVATGTDLSTYAMAAEPYMIELFEGAGYRLQSDDPHGMNRYLHDLAIIADPMLPAGFTARPINGPDDVPARVEVHRSAFAPSRVTPESYTNVMAAPPYRMDLDWVVQAPDGRLAANCLIWLDESSGCGLVEPVGTHADFRRLGLSRAVCLAALRALRDLGGTSAVVNSYETPENPGPAALYRGLGFRDRTHTVLYVKSIAEKSA
jgi:GNAT superfamily N-acetyltransferase